MKRVQIFLILVMFVFGDCFLQSSNRVEAAGPALVPAAAAIGALQMAQVTIASAFAMGAISSVQKEEYQREISRLVEKIKTSTGEVLKASIDQSTQLLRVLSGKAANACEKKRDEDSSQRRSQCKGSPEECCGDFFSKFSDLLDKERGGYKVYHNRRQKSREVDCCLEWDTKHGGFEIFDDKGNHLGERGCDDLSDDPCSFTQRRGRHAKPESSSHHPRSRLCSH